MLENMKGERALDFLADAMALAEEIGSDKRFKSFAADIKKAGEDGAWRVLCKYLPPILRDENYKSRILALLASIKGVPADEYAESGDVLADLYKLVTSEVGALGFLFK